MNGERVGIWALPSRGGQEFRYAESWLGSSQFRPLSLSLPAGLGTTALQGAAVGSWFENLLPDSSAIRQRVQRRFQAASSSAFDLLAAVGRDCAGAVQVLPLDEEPSGLDRIEATPLSEQEIGQVLRGVVAPALPGFSGPAAEELRLSVAGAQEKTALLRHNGRWCRPLNSTPTTHLFKLPMGTVGNGQIDFSTSVENEWLCGRLLRAYGIDVAASQIASFAGERCLIVERFDRRLHPTGSHWLRLPTEDFCQVTGTPPEAKYENQGGPGLVAISAWLAQSSAAGDLCTFYRAQVLFWMLRAIDGHAKNFSLFLNPGGRYQLTPLYDVLSAWPVIGTGTGMWPQQEIRMAMAWYGSKSRTYKPLQIQRRHLISTAQKLGLGGTADTIVDALVESTPGVIDAVRAEVPSGCPEELAESVFRGLQSSADQINK
ncbi:type II toxin-antitoxin system HipA family toxin [Synechococcus sp. CS-603]|nr:type II toxin-antitoxin system HipA family toxin [Synechococcus sp. CS-603]